MLCWSFDSVDGTTLDSPSATSTAAASLSLTPIFCVTTKLFFGTNWSCVVTLLFNPVGSVAVHLPLLSTVTLSTTVFPATLILIVAPGVPVPDKVLSVDLIPPFRNIPPSEGNVLVTSGVGTANTYFNSCPPFFSVTVLAPGLYVLALCLFTSLRVYPLAFIALIVFCNEFILFRFTTWFSSPGTAVFDANSFPCSSTYFTWTICGAVNSNLSIWTRCRFVPLPVLPTNDNA